MVTLHEDQLRQLLEEAARRGAHTAFEELTLYHLKDAAARLGMSYNTLQKRILEGKIETVDGRITGAEIRRYLKLN